MPGSRITKKQEEIYMRSRQTGLSQEVAAAKRGVSVRSGRRIERGERSPVLRAMRTAPGLVHSEFDRRLRRLARTPAGQHRQCLAPLCPRQPARRRKPALKILTIHDQTS